MSACPAGLIWCSACARPAWMPRAPLAPAPTPEASDVKLSDAELLLMLKSTGAGASTLAIVKLSIAHFDLLPLADGDKVGAELKKAVPVLCALLMCYIVYRLLKPGSTVAAPAIKEKVK